MNSLCKVLKGKRIKVCNSYQSPTRMMGGACLTEVKGLPQNMEKYGYPAANQKQWTGTKGNGSTTGATTTLPQTFFLVTYLKSWISFFIHRERRAQCNENGRQTESYISPTNSARDMASSPFSSDLRFFSLNRKCSFHWSKFISKTFIILEAPEL